MTNGNPLVGPPPAEVPLPHAPLVRVIAQVRFPAIFLIEQQEFIASFQEVVRRDFPVLRPEQRLHASSDQELRTGRTWRFQDAKGSWKLTVAADFLSLDTNAYVSRKDFLDRWERVVHLLKDHVDPGLVDRIGLRYVDRLTGEDLAGVLPTLVRSELAGVAGTVLTEHVRHAVSENLFGLPEEEGELRVRAGWIPPRSTVDPTTIEPIEETSWLLDLDAFRLATQPFDPEGVVSTTRAFAERIYAFFRWAITPAFLQRYGGAR